MWGLAVLITLFLYIRLAMWVAKKLSDKRESKQWKWGVRVCVTLVFVLIPTWDSILGQLYLNNLCSTEAGVKVYQTVELPAEYWDAQGAPRFIAKNGFVDMKLLPARYQWHSIDESYIDSVIKIEKWRWQLIDVEAQKVLGERVAYMRHFGWFNRFSPAPNIGEGCELSRDQEQVQEQNFFRAIFKPATSTR